MEIMTQCLVYFFWSFSLDCQHGSIDDDAISSRERERKTDRETYSKVIAVAVVATVKPPQAVVIMTTTTAAAAFN